MIHYGQDVYTNKGKFYIQYSQDGPTYTASIFEFKNPLNEHFIELDENGKKFESFCSIRDYVHNILKPIICFSEIEVITTLPKPLKENNVK